jgi:hypothetical protein
MSHNNNAMESRGKFLQRLVYFVLTPLSYLLRLFDNRRPDPDPSKKDKKSSPPDTTYPLW